MVNPSQFPYFEDYIAVIFATERRKAKIRNCLFIVSDGKKTEKVVTFSIEEKLKETFFS